jgi:galactosamine-6-phosphate isomerase
MLMRITKVRNMEVRIYPDADTAGYDGAGVVLNVLKGTPKPLMCVAAGNSPVPLYRTLATLLARDQALTSTLRVIKLDEWLGVSPEEPGSCEHFIRTHLVEPSRLPLSGYIGFSPDERIAAEEVCRIDTFLESDGPIDLAVLGLGLNGHIGFNEPGEYGIAESHVVSLSRDSLNHPMVQISGHRPVGGITIGLRALLNAGKIILVVTGSKKREQLSRLLEGQITPRFPASFLHLHRNVLCLTDEDAFR